MENLVLGKKSNQQTKNMRTKTNNKPKAKDKGKENNAIFSKPGRVQYKNNELKLNSDVPYSRMSLETFQMAQRIILSFNPVTKSLGKFERRFKWLNCANLSTMWNRTDSRFVAGLNRGLNNILDRFLCKADFILSRHFTLLHNRFVKPPDWIWELFRKIILATGRVQETVKWEKKGILSLSKIRMICSLALYPWYS